MPKKFSVKILPRDEVLDSQGRAVRQTLIRKGFDLKDCHVGKVIVLETETGCIEEAKKMTEELLYNPLIEKYEIEELK